MSPCRKSVRQDAQVTYYCTRPQGHVGDCQHNVDAARHQREAAEQPGAYGPMRVMSIPDDFEKAMAARYASYRERSDRNYDTHGVKYCGCSTCRETLELGSQMGELRWVAERLGFDLTPFGGPL